MVSVCFLSWTYPLGSVFALKVSFFLSFKPIMRNKWRVTKSINRHRPEEKKTSCLFSIFFSRSRRFRVCFRTVTEHHQIYEKNPPTCTDHSWLFSSLDKHTNFSHCQHPQHCTLLIHSSKTFILPALFPFLSAMMRVIVILREQKEGIERERDRSVDHFHPIGVTKWVDCAEKRSFPPEWYWSMESVGRAWRSNHRRKWMGFSFFSNQLEYTTIWRSNLYL